MPQNNAHKALEQLGRQWSNPQASASWIKQTHQELGKTMIAWTKKNFDGQGRLLQSGSWIPRSSSSKKRNTRPLLVNTGKLRNSFKLLQSSKDIKATNTAAYAVLHHLGQGVPKRPLFPELPQAETLLKQNLKDRLSKLPFIPKYIP